MRVSVGLVGVLVGCGHPLKTVDDLPWSSDPPAESIPYGFWGLNGYLEPDTLPEVRDRFGLAVVSTATRHPHYAVTELFPMVRDAGMQVNLRLVGDHSYYTDDAGNFDVEAWKSMLDEWADSGVQEYIDDGTFAWHMMIDDITEFPGEGPTGDELEEMSVYSGRVMPGLPTLVRANATELPTPSGGTYEWLGASVNQYVSADGDAVDFAVAQHDRAGELGVGIVMGLNIADGGDGSSLQPGWSEGKWAMTADEITGYGEILSTVPDTLGFLNWEYDAEETWPDGTIGADYFDEAGRSAALTGLGDRLAGG